MHPSRHSLLIACLLATFWLTAGCAGYRLGPTSQLAARARSACVLPFTNQTLEPRLPEAVQSALRHSLNQEGTFRPARQRDADILISGTLLSYERTPVAFASRDIRTVTDFDARLTARVRAIDRLSGRTLVDQEVHGRTIIRIIGDQPSAERQALPIIAADLSRNITALLVDGDW